MHYWPESGTTLSYIIVGIENCNLVGSFTATTVHILNSSRTVFPHKCKAVSTLLFEIMKIGSIRNREMMRQSIYTT